MKAIIEINESGLASLDFKKEKKQINWEELTRVEQIRLLKALSNFHELFSKFIKPEENEKKIKKNSHRCEKKRLK